MRFKISLTSKLQNSLIPINYQYPLSAAIYKILANANAEYATFLHEKGYRADYGLKRFKLFTFSDMQARFKLRGDRMHLLSNPELLVSFHLPEAARHFVKGLFFNQEVCIADKYSKCTFQVSMVRALPSPFEIYEEDERVNFRCSPISPIVAGMKNDTGEYTFLHPSDIRYQIALQYNWQSKLASLGIEESEDNLGVKVLPPLNNFKKRGVFIKAHTQAQTKIIGYTQFSFELIGKKKYVELLYNAGLGLYNAQGMGCVNIVKQNADLTDA